MTADALDAARAATAEMFTRAREADIEAVAGVKLFRAGRRLRGECPMCGASKGKRSGGAFSVEAAMGVFKCWGCDEGGDVIDLERALRGGTPREAAERLAGGAVRPVATRRVAVPTKPLRPPTEHPIWRAAELQPVFATAAGAYFEARGVLGQVLSGLGARLRFHPRAPWAWDEAQGDWIRAPGIVGQVVMPTGPTGGVHVTYLAKDLLSKARLDPAKRMWGPQKDLEGRAGGVWLSPIDGPGPLIVGEGIESTLSAMQLWSADHAGAACRGVAALSLGALQGGWLADRYGRVDPAMPTPDPESPAFTWPNQDQVLIAVDRDMKPIRRKARKLGGGTAEVELDAEARARICAGLAVAAWKRAGANDVRAIAPAAGRDFNDELVARLAG